MPEICQKRVGLIWLILANFITSLKTRKRKGMCGRSREEKRKIKMEVLLLYLFLAASMRYAVCYCFVMPEIYHYERWRTNNIKARRRKRVALKSVIMENGNLIKYTIKLKFYGCFLRIKFFFIFLSKTLEAW